LSERQLALPRAAGRDSTRIEGEAVAEILPQDQALETACRLLEAGELVAIPTETVYGLAADATNGEAVARIFEAKGRPRFNPLIAHVAEKAMAERIAVFSPQADRLAKAFWPGPLTLVLPHRKGSGIHPLVTARLDTIALRCPQGFGRQVIARLGRPLAAPSANISGRVTGTAATAAHAAPQRVMRGKHSRRMHPLRAAAERLNSNALDLLVRESARAQKPDPVIFHFHYGRFSADRGRTALNDQPAAVAERGVHGCC